MSEKNAKVDWQMADRIFELLIRGLFVVLTILVAVIAYQGREVLQTMADHEVRLTKVESTRYTPEQAKLDLQANKNEMKEFIKLHIVPINETLREIKDAVKENRDARFK